MHPDKVKATDARRIWIKVFISRGASKRLTVLFNDASV